MDASPSSMWKLCPLYTSRGNVQIVSESELTPTIAEYEIPVSWGCFGIVTIEATSMQEAINTFDREAEEYPLPAESDYITESLHENTIVHLRKQRNVMQCGFFPVFIHLKRKLVSQLMKRNSPQTEH